MNDYEKLKDVFIEIGVEFKEKDAYKDEGKNTQVISYDGTVTFDKYLELKNGVGYYYFKCDFYFLNGAYVGHGVWE